MKRRFTPKKVLNYLVLALVAYLAYRVLVKDGSNDPYGNRDWQHPKHVGAPDQAKGEEKILRADDLADDELVRGDRKPEKGDNSVEAEKERARKEKAQKELLELEERIKKEKEELEQELTLRRKEKERIEDLLKEEKRLLQQAKQSDLDLDEDESPAQKETFKAKPPDAVKKDAKEPEVDKERERRRREFFDLVARNKADFDEEEETDFHERDDLLNFVTALSPNTYRAGLQLIHSVQRFFPKQGVGIYDLGLSSDQRSFLKSVCNVTLHELWLMAWPGHIQNVSTTMWRPVLLQLALSEFGHFIYVEPELVLKNSNIKPYIQHSRRKGVVLVGKRKKYSSYVVTHPEMLYYLSADVRKLQKLPHVELSMVLMHSTTTVRQRFMNLLIACTVEEWCISPPGSKRNCDHRLFAGSKKYADCHRYDESAVNVLLKHWSQYQEDTYFARDVITTHYDGTDVTDTLRRCEPKRRKLDL